MILWCPTNHAECKLMQCACCILYPELVPCYDSSESSAACFCSYFYAFDHPFHSFDLRPSCFWALSSFPCHPSWNLWEAICNWPTVASADTPRRRPSRFCSGHWSAWSPVRMRCPPSCATPAPYWYFTQLSSFWSQLFSLGTLGNGTEIRWRMGTPLLLNGMWSSSMPDGILAAS